MTAARAEDAEERGEGICRTCLAPIWNEGGTVDHRRRPEGWSDRIERGGDSQVCFKAVDYRHVPLTGREACIYDRAYARGASGSVAIDVPVLLNDLADSIETGQVYGMPHAAAEWNLALTHAAEVVRVAAEGWGS